MSRWSHNGHGWGEAEAFDDAVVEELVAGRYQGDAPDLVAVSRFVEKVRAYADQPAPPPSLALARILGDAAPAGDGGPSTVARRWRQRTGVVPGFAVAAAVCAVLIAAVIGAGSARLLPGPTQDVVANIVRTMTPFGFPQRTEPEPALPGTSKPAPAAPSEADGTRAGAGSAPPGARQPATDGAQPVGGDRADGGSQPNRASPPPNPATTTTPPPRPTPTVQGPNGPPRQVTSTSSPPSPPGPADYKADLLAATGTPGAGDQAGSGTALFDARPARDQLCLTLVVSGTAPVTSVHVHAGAAGAVGPVVASFKDPTAATSGHCVIVPDQLLREIRKDPGRYYVDVHVSGQEDEALRGQLHR